MSYSFSTPKTVSGKGLYPDVVELVIKFTEEVSSMARFVAVAQAPDGTTFNVTRQSALSYARNSKTWPGQEELNLKTGRKYGYVFEEMLSKTWATMPGRVKPSGVGKWDDLTSQQREQIVNYLTTQSDSWELLFDIPEGPVGGTERVSYKFTGSVSLRYNLEKLQAALKGIFPSPSDMDSTDPNSASTPDEDPAPVPETNRQPDPSLEEPPGPPSEPEFDRRETLEDLISRAVGDNSQRNEEPLCDTPACDEELEQILSESAAQTNNNEVAQEVVNVGNKINAQTIAQKSQNTTIPSIFKPDVNVSCIPGSIEEKKSKSSPDRKEKTGGVFCQHIREPVPALVKAEVEVVHKNEYNSWIVLGKDRPSSLASGYGGKGHTQCGSVDIVVGRMSANPKEVDKQGKSVYTEPNFYSDAARIHISQKTDVDRNFGIVKGKNGESVGVSGIGIKADAVRVVARTGGIKLVTNTDLKDSRGGEVRSFRGVELIAGNDDEDMQAMVKGKNLRRCIIAVMKEVERTQGLLFAFMKEQVEYNIAMMNHRHITVFPGQESIVSIGGLTAGTKNICQVVGPLTINAALLKSNIPLIRASYLLPSGRSFILSRYHYLN